MKKTLLIILTMVLVIGSITGCGGNSGNTGQTTEKETKPIVLKLAHVEAMDRSIHTSAEDFKKFVEEKTNGRVEVQLFPNGQLGGDKDVLEGIQLNTIQMSIMGASVLGSFDDKFGVLDLPYLFDSYEDMSKAVCGPLGDLYNSWLLEYGFMGLGFEYDGARSISNNVRPINSVADVKGLKLRVMQTQVYISMMNLMGANPTPMSFTELYTSLAQGVVDGQDNPPSIAYTNNFQEVQKYYSWTRHTFQNGVIVTSKAFMDSLPGDIRDVIIEGALMMQNTQRDFERSLESDYEKKIGESGTCTVNEVPAANMKGFRDAVAPIYDEFRGLIGKDVMEQVLAAAGKTGQF